MQKPAPMIQEMMIMIRNGKRTPENIERAMGNCLFEYLLNTAPVMQPRMMPPNTPVSSTWMPITVLWPVPVRPSMPFASAREPVALSTMLLACRNRKNDIRAISEAWPLFFFAMAPAMPTQNRIERLLMINISD